MMRVFFVLLFVCVLISCGENPQEKKVGSIAGSEFSIPHKHDLAVYINASSAKEIADWEYYQSLQEFILRFENATPNEALGNALELASLIKTLKDSVKPAPVNTPSFDARVNLLENESLRLSDMTKIQAITAEEVNQQISKIFDAFSSVNAKINTVYLQKRLNEDADLNDLVFSPLDTNLIKTPQPIRKKLIPKEKSLQKKVPLKQKILPKKQSNKKNI